MEVTGMELHGKSVFGGIAMGRLSVYHKTDNAVKRTKITDGGNVYLFATTLADSSKILVKCSKL